MWISLSAIAQETPPGQEQNLFCQPGVPGKSPGKGIYIKYGVRAPYTYQAQLNGEQIQNQVQGNNRLTMKIKLPVVLSPGFKMLAGFSHNRERFNFSNIHPENTQFLNHLDTATYKNTRLTLYALKPLGSTSYLALRAGVGFNGDYEGLIRFDHKYAIYRLAGIWGIKNRDDLEWGVGLYYRKSFRNWALYPFLIYNRNFNEKWGVESIFPVSVKLRYNITPGNLLLFCSEYASEEFATDLSPLDGGAAQHFFFRHANIRFNLTYQHRMTSWTWLEFQTGYTQPFRSRFQKAVTADRYFFTPQAGLYGSIGFFVSPPRKDRS